MTTTDLWAALAKEPDAFESLFAEMCMANECQQEMPSNVVATFDAFSYLREYFESRSNPDVREAWILAHEIAFREIVTSRRRFLSPADKILFVELAFLLIDDPTPRPLSREIEKLGTAYEFICGVLRKILPGQYFVQRDDLRLLGPGPTDVTGFVMAAELRSNYLLRRFARTFLTLLCAA
jgi:hypothetical protein